MSISPQVRQNSAIQRLAYTGDNSGLKLVYFAARTHREMSRAGTLQELVSSLAVLADFVHLPSPEEPPNSPTP